MKSNDYFDVIRNLILHSKVDLAICASYAISLLMAAGAYHVVILCAQLTRDLLAIAKFLVIPCQRPWRSARGSAFHGQSYCITAALSRSCLGLLRTWVNINIG